uniref:OTU domain-containing protein n=1 Tax=Lactuca sativa TaxID=4236 RepID=A0A9R1W296_LACSA|nr:hypothetical protein LSAT_V11C300123480 [Lactuca sativa]
MPFVEIVGVTSTNKTFSIAFAFIINEKEESYKWVLMCLRLTLEKCMQPRVIVTDRELALVNACQQVFPYATRLLCRWHITENIRKHCKALIPLKAEWKSFRVMWSILVESPTWTSYTENYRKLQSMLREHQDVLQYLDDVWLNKYKEMFVSVWIDQHLNFGQRTSSRVEGQHSVLKKYLQEKNYSLAKFVGAIDRFVKSQLTAINESFEKSMIVSKHEHRFSCFDLLRGNVSLKALDMLIEELQRVYQVDSSNCGCKLQNSCGLPCACMLSAYLNSDICGDGKFEMFKETYNKQPEAVKKSMMRKLLDIFQPSKTHIREPAIQKNTRGRPSLKKQKQKQTDSINQAPRRRSFSTMPKFVELNNREPARHSSYITTIPDLKEEPDLNEIPDLKEEPDLNEIPDLKEEPQSCYNHRLIDEIQVMFHPYITHIQDVEGDGNCGFRAISVCLGYGENDWLYVRRQLLDELLSSYDAYARVFTDGIGELYTSLNFLESPAPKRYWLLMPETCILIANRFGVVLTFLTNQGSLTFFPLWKGPEEFLYHRVITISLVYGNHYVMVQLEGDCPLPTISAFWIRHKAPCAAGWETMFMSRLELYRQLKPYNPETPFITIEDC